MDPTHYYKSITLELDALKDRVRYLIDGTHWPTDGEWKESVLRSVLRRHLPPTVGVGRGFVVSEHTNSQQTDVLLYDTSRPLLHQEGDLVFVTPDAVKGIVEVKSTLRRGELGESLNVLSAKAALVPNGSKSVFLGLFGFDSDLGANATSLLLDLLQESADGKRRLAVTHVCAGWDHFVRYWDRNPMSDAEMDCWYSYDVHRIAPGYFLANALEAVVGDPVSKNLWAWFPWEGKEIHKTEERPLIPESTAMPFRGPCNER